jgi:diphosphomevalonate decarboxylase
MHWLANAPANIALIKYMGKKEGGNNLPDNASLSYTLNQLLTTVRLSPIKASKDRWALLDMPKAAPFNLSVDGQNRFIQHCQRIKNYFGYQGSFLIESCNNFPHGSGLASSASSFAALTRCVVAAMSDLTGKPISTIDTQAQWSRQGSGSSCRSFYTPWALWDDDSVRSLTLPEMDLIHEVVVIHPEEKKISSSLAHLRVKSSPLYMGRSLRASRRLQTLLSAFELKDWYEAYKICWDEFQDMHQLFTSCDQPFTYMMPQSIQLLEQLQRFWESQGDGPLVTMDAGPNIHLLYKSHQKETALRFRNDYLVGHYEVL